MARLRHFASRELLEECLEILRVRFPKATLILNEGSCGRYKHCFEIDARMPPHVGGMRGDRFDLMDCLQWLKFEYGNVGFMLS